MKLSIIGNVTALTTEQPLGQISFFIRSHLVTRRVSLGVAHFHMVFGCRPDRERDTCRNSANVSIVSLNLRYQERFYLHPKFRQLQRLLGPAYRKNAASKRMSQGQRESLAACTCDLRGRISRVRWYTFRRISAPFLPTEVSSHDSSTLHLAQFMVTGKDDHCSNGLVNAACTARTI